MFLFIKLLFFALEIVLFFFSGGEGIIAFFWGFSRRKILQTSVFLRDRWGGSNLDVSYKCSIGNNDEHWVLVRTEVGNKLHELDVQLSHLALNKTYGSLKKKGVSITPIGSMHGIFYLPTFWLIWTVNSMGNEAQMLWATYSYGKWRCLKVSSLFWSVYPPKKMVRLQTYQNLHETSSLTSLEIFVVRFRWVS